MSITTHPVEREKIMAFLDGELSHVDSQAILNHIDLCSECAHVAEQLRATSESLSAWKVPAIPTSLEESITNFATRTASGEKTGRADLFIRTSFWTWKQWAIVSGSAMAALSLALAISLPILHRSPQLAKEDTAYYYQRTEREGSLGKLQGSGAPIISQQSKVFRGQVVTQSSPGVATDSNGLFHGLGDHARDSFSIDGKPLVEQQNSLAPMIARTVSLTIVVKDFAACRSSLDRILERHHGYPAQLSVSTPEDAPRSLQASLMIPAPQLSSMVNDLKLLGRVENESQSGEEVTKQHTDLVARLKNSRDTEQRFRAILQQRTGMVSEVLQVEEGIARVRGDIERMEAEQKALEHRVDFATVELQITEEYKAQLNPPAASVSTRMHNGLVAGYQNASETVFGIVLFFAEYGPAFLVWIAILLLPIAVLWRRYRRTLAAT